MMIFISLTCIGGSRGDGRVWIPSPGKSRVALGLSQEKNNTLGREIHTAICDILKENNVPMTKLTEFSGSVVATHVHKGV